MTYDEDAQRRAKAEFHQRAQAELESMRARLEQLDAELRKADATTRAAVESQVADMKAKLKEAEGRMKEFGETSLTALAKIKTGFDMAFEDIRRAFAGAGPGGGAGDRDRSSPPRT